MKTRASRLSFAAAFAVAHASAQGRPPRIVPLPARAPEIVARGDLGVRFGLSAAERLLTSPDSDERLRGVLRLQAIGTPAALETLVRAMDPGSAFVRDPRARLLAVRALAAHASDEGPRGVLLRSMSEALPADRTAFAELIGQTAALALARHGGTRGGELLAAIVRQGGRLGEVANAALEAHPPVSLDALAGPRAPLSLDVARLLGAMGDLRALPWLRAAVRTGDPKVRAAALLSLAKLSDQEATVIARAFAKAADPDAKLAAARALSLVAPDEARAIIVELFSSDATRSEALDLAQDLGGGALAPALLQIAEGHGPARDRRRAVMALGLSPSESGAKALGGLLGDTDVAPSAILSLGLMRGAEASRVITRRLADDPTRAGAFRAATIRAIALGSAFVGDDTKLPDSMRAFTAAARSGDRPSDEQILASPELSSAVALGLLSRGGADVRSLDGLLARADGPVAEALAVVLVGESAVSSSTLWTLVESRGPALPLATLVLASRDDSESRARLDTLMRSTDPVVRAHVAMGLARHDGDGAEGRLVAMYTFELDPSVRRAIVRGLALSKGPQARALRLSSRDLDPDLSVRRASLALTASARSSRDLVTVIGGAPGARLRVERPDGVAIPVIVGADGVALVPGVSAGVGRVIVLPASP